MCTLKHVHLHAHTHTNKYICMTHTCTHTYVRTHTCTHADLAALSTTNSLKVMGEREWNDISKNGTRSPSKFCASPIPVSPVVCFSQETRALKESHQSVAPCWALSHCGQALNIHYIMSCLAHSTPGVLLLEFNIRKGSNTSHISFTQYVIMPQLTDSICIL